MLQFLEDLPFRKQFVVVGVIGSVLGYFVYKACMALADTLLIHGGYIVP